MASQKPCACAAHADKPAKPAPLACTEERCTRCRSNTADKNMITVKDKVLHKKCFKCEDCQAPLDPDRFYEHEGHYYCYQHVTDFQKSPDNWRKQFFPDEQ